MCIFPTLLRNPKYKQNKKNGGIVPAVTDERTLWLPIGCGECMECKAKKARDWTVRLMEDIRENRNGKMVVLTLSNESYKELLYEVKRIGEAKVSELRPKEKAKKEKRARENHNIPDWVVIDTIPNEKYENNSESIKERENKKQIERERRKMEGYGLDNAIATLAMRRFNERWRKKHKKAVRHWTVTELGHNGTENIHLHGIIWTDETWDEIRAIWKYGYIYPRNKWEEERNYVSERTINYCVKYILKVDKDHEYYKGIILTSPGIGSNYGTSLRYRENKYQEEGETKDSYTTRTGHEISLPIYYRNNIYTDEQKEKLWIEKLNKQIRYVNKIKIDISKNEKEYWKTLKHAQKINRQLGYGNGKTDWTKKEYEEERRKMMQNKRIE